MFKYKLGGHNIQEETENTFKVILPHVLISVAATAQTTEESSQESIETGSDSIEGNTHKNKEILPNKS